MKQPIVKSLVLAGALTMGIAACSSSPASGPSGTAKGQPLVIVSNVGQTFARSFNPFVSTSLGNSNSTTALIYEPLLMFNIMKPSQPPIPWLATAYHSSTGGNTPTLPLPQPPNFTAAN